jgi:hypothetical protein
MIAHEAIGGNADRAERLEFAKDRAEDLLFPGMEDDALVDDAGNTMIEVAIRQNDSWRAHGTKKISSQWFKSNIIRLPIY